ncbi:class I SAM-dependent methyltransferase [Bifidobacterium magnum]|uniref:Methyltransferase n=1 Tax=Bifidobacterium magnum TaxID=1692 RepID=A0A087BAM2_9BIFI|nr:class I SAM-dependent methyltransferase [Bifidobacterium magnum]KFI68072.1 Methyltransferase [Bifidobacterium magnum]
MHITAQTWQFIADHEGENVQKLALQAKRDSELDLPFALDQIRGREIARHKLPQWAAIPNMIYPPHLAMEQCSSEATALHKVQLAQRLLAQTDTPANAMVDLTGGFGVDFSYLARLFASATYVERQEQLCTITEHNMRELGLAQAHIVHEDSTEYVRTMDPVDLIYIDPARRDAAGARTFAIEDCTPNVLELWPTFLEKSPVTLIKLSPMLDWRKTVRDFAPHVALVSIISVGNECKELVVGLTRESHDRIEVICINNDDQFEFFADNSGSIIPDQSPEIVEQLQQDQWKYLYEPNVSLMKAGCYELLEQRYGARQIDTNSHILVSDRHIADFPGRTFRIESVGTMNKKSIRSQFAGITHANVAVRNFPLTAVQLAKKLKLKDGSDTYVFGTTAHGQHLLLVCAKATQEA